MRVESLPTTGSLSGAHRRQYDHEVQSVFSEILAAAGREGYASAKTGSQDQPLVDRVSMSWSSWFDGEFVGGRYQGEVSAEALKHSYGEILARACQEAGYVDPKGFLQSLSSEEMAVVQRVHRLADTIGVDALSEEGALNLLLPPAAQVDLDHDGLTRSGAAYGLRFPDSNTPAAVVEAWEEATEGMSFKELAVYQLQMKLPLLTANIVCDENGAFIKRYEPGDPEFINPMASGDYSYIQAVQDRLDGLDFVKGRIPQDQYDRDKAFWTTLKGLLIEHGSA